MCTEVLSCAACEAFRQTGFGKGTVGATGEVRDGSGKVVRHGATEVASVALLDEAGRIVDVREYVEPHPFAGQPVTFKWFFCHHDGGQPHNRREGLPDGFLLTGLERQVLEVLDHWVTTETDPRRPVAHLQRSGAHGPECQWLRDIARLSQRVMSDRRPWHLIRRAAARAVIATVLGVSPGTVRRRIQNYLATKTARP